MLYKTELTTTNINANVNKCKNISSKIINCFSYNSKFKNKFSTFVSLTSVKIRRKTKKTIKIYKEI